jgi:hypothetical protein
VIRRDVGNQSIFKGNFLDLTGHISQINQQPIYLCHPHQRILLRARDEITESKEKNPAAGRNAGKESGVYA